MMYNVNSSLIKFLIFPFVEENLGLLPASLALADRILELKAGKITSRS